MLSPQAAAKKPYIPSKGIRPKTTEVPKLPDELVRLSVDAALRSIPWTEGETRAPQVDVPPAVRGATIDARTPVRLAFGVEVAWTGQREGAPSAAQTIKSVKTVLAQFQWE